MFIFINPWTSYKKEDIEAISEVMLHNSSVIIPCIMLFVNIITIGLWVWICYNEFLFSIAVPSLCILTFIILVFDIIYIIDLWKEKKKHSEN
jgi:hypothetical protein